MSWPVILVIMVFQSVFRIRHSSRFIFQVTMAQRHRQGVGNVGRLGQLRQVQFALDGLLHLQLVGPAGAGEDPLDLRRGVVHDGDARLGRRQANHAAGMAHEDGRPRPPVVRIKLFDGHHAGPQGGDHVGHALMDLQQAAGERAPRLAADHARLAQPRRPAADLQHAVAGDVQAGVDAEDAVGRLKCQICKSQ